MNAEKFNYNELENVTSAEFVCKIKQELENGAKLVCTKKTEYYVYVDLFDDCFEHYVFDPDTKDYRVTYLSLGDVRTFADFMKKEGAVR